jgi:hypothetical protein
MSIMTGAQLRLLEGRIAEIERRLAALVEGHETANDAAAEPEYRSSENRARKSRRQSRKAP